MYSLEARQPHGVEPCMLYGITIISGTFMFLVLPFGVLLISFCMVLLKAYLMLHCYFVGLLQEQEDGNDY
jgi:hypothetical protein